MHTNMPFHNGTSHTSINIVVNTVQTLYGRNLQPRQCYCSQCIHVIQCARMNDIKILNPWADVLSILDA
jgi:hypothetical protein